MRKAYDAIILREDTDVLHPEDLYTVMQNNSILLKGTNAHMSLFSDVPPIVGSVLY